MSTILRKIFVLVQCVLTVGILTANAQAPADSVVAKEEKKDSPLTISGYADVYYTYNFNNPAYVNNSPFTVEPLGFGVQNPGRVFDIKHNSFSIGLVQTKFTYTKNRSELVMDLTFGPNAELGNFGNVFGSMINIKQAYFSYDVTPKLTVTAGQFGTHIGYELIDAPVNTNYSLSYLFGNGPFYHTGLKAAYTFSDKVGLMGGIVNGWDAMYGFNDKMSFIGQLSYSPNDKIDLYVNFITGDNKNSYSFPTTGAPGAAIPDSIKTNSTLFDLTGTYQVTDKFKVGVNAAYGFGHIKPDSTTEDGFNDATWYGAALYLNYAFTDAFTLSLRSEHFSDKDGVRYVGALLGAGSFNEFTLTADFSLDEGSLHLKPEFRIDVADKDCYIKNPGSKNPSATSTQPTLGMAAVYKF